MMSQQILTKNITVYTKENCVYCVKAKSLLKGLGLKFTEKKIETDFKSVDAMIADIGKKVRAMPQIKIDKELIGFKIEERIIPCRLKITKKEDLWIEPLSQGHVHANIISN